ncbi:MAG: NADH-quinone oxidoreductase subunit J [Methanosarcina thermophila]|jgi:NADH:ubiquinone oxidoreductase subunit 6 (subunit J)|uniref:F420H2 dehydrogenase subunit J n=3 Tax=Methanosarcina thermophila TaxID=2210 RepID=A0A1I6Z600_METTE|nr:NADH-quinone oxidoreductase subunit J [Methanosarcina thermophila]AKB11961.1 NADH dehydrogenase subunit J [Methanosarcina thermophila TM-1]AKB14846.1 NADH dehydrogenase subunit J [Methanosarcina thermophila CHTI-55]SFT58136.1 F420H2 dehydrogenase subunit J [Methanosarcina thermophila]BAW29605.1 F420H2 dehydrogenase subunit J [Methanosarcina thermophila]GLI14102.1 NADH dehydrogenase subunit J [Methanosarcina thermophila MST-A1]
MIWLEAMGLETIELETIGAALQMAVFGLLAVITVFFAIFVVIAKDVVRAGLALILCMFGIAALYILLNAQFLGVIQVLIYIGAIGVLILFAVMLTKREIGGEPGAD